MSIKSGLDLYVVQLALEQHEVELCRSTSIRVFFSIDLCSSTDHSSIDLHDSNGPCSSNLYHLRINSMVGNTHMIRLTIIICVFSTVGEVGTPNLQVVQRSTVFDFNIEGDIERDTCHKF